jgi:outer membrane receptor for ferrienterochelin and colicins
VNYTGTYTPNFGSVVLDVSGFYTYFSNKIVPDYTSDPQQIIYRNLAGYGISKGVSANVDFSFRNGLKALLGGTLMEVYNLQESVDGTPSKQVQLFAPSWQATWAVTYGWRAAGLTFDLTGKVYGPQRLPVVPNDYRPEYSPIFALANFQATKKIREGFEVYAAVKNLLNFLPAGAILHPDDPFDQAGGKYFDAGGAPRPDTNPYGYTFDPSYNYAPLQGIKGLIGVRYSMK